MDHPLQYRVGTVELDRASRDARTVRVAFSSQAPVLREDDFGLPFWEVIGHGPGEIDLSLLNTGAPALVEHDKKRKAGAVVKNSARIDPDYVGRATIKLSRSPEGVAVEHDIEDEIAGPTSIGYRVFGWREDGEDKDGIPVRRAVKTIIEEISFVSLAADRTVGVNRSYSPSNKMTTPNADTIGKDTIKVLAAQYATRHADKADIINHTASRMEIEGADVAEFKRFLLDDVLGSSPIPNGDEPFHTRDGNTNTTSAGWTAQAAQTIKRCIGEDYIHSAEYQQFKRGAMRGKYNFSVSSPGTLPQHLTRATVTSSGLTAIQKVPGVVILDQQPPRIADLFGQGTTSSSTIRYTKETTYTNGATAVAEEGLKPEATFVLAEAEVAVKKLAVIGRATDESLADYEYMQSYITGRLTFMLASKEDSDLLNANGGSSITGILNVSGIQTESAVASSIAHDAVYKAITKIRTNAQLEADAIVVHPDNWEDLVLTKDGSSQYYAGGPFNTGAYGTGRISGENMWGRPVIVTTAITAGTILVGAFKMGATVFRRSGIQVDTTNSDGDDFKYNRVAIRAEERLCLVPFRPAAFCLVTGVN